MENQTCQLSKQDIYIMVKRENTDEITYGGDQNFFESSDPKSEDYLKNKMGCGAVALGDLFLYLAMANPRYQTIHTGVLQGRMLTEAEYKTYYDVVYHMLGGTSEKLGISGLRLVRVFNKVARAKKWKLRARWGALHGKMLPRIQKMLEKDMPVILCVPPNFFHKNKKDQIGLYCKQNEEYIQASGTYGHYVVVTAVEESPLEESTEKRTMLSVSSWGKRYYIDYAELLRFNQRHFLGNLLGNIMDIK